MCSQITDVTVDRFSISSIQLADLGGNDRFLMFDVSDPRWPPSVKFILFNYAATGSMRVS